MIILSTILLIILNGVISSMVRTEEISFLRHLRFGRNWGLAYAVFSAAGIRPDEPSVLRTTALVLSLEAGL